METIKRKVADALLNSTVEVKNSFKEIIANLVNAMEEVDHDEYEVELELAKYKLRGIFRLAISSCYVRQNIYRVKVDEVVWFVNGWFLLPDGLMFNRLDVINLWFEDIKAMF